VAVAVVDFLVFQGVWLATVAGAGRGLPWIGPLVVPAYLAVQLLRAPAPTVGRRLATMGTLALAGWVIDSTQQGLGLLAFAGAPARWLAPAWIPALWAELAGAEGLLSALGRRPLLGAALGALGGPLSFAAGARLAAVRFPADPRPSYLVLALVWAIVVPLLARHAAVAPAFPPSESLLEVPR
jgi:hypothetical protein